MTDFRSYKWITADTTQAGRSIQVSNVSQAFGSVAKNHCNLISIFGRARQGKSFLMNCLAGEKDIFRISNEKESCTQGIDISNKWLSLNDFSRIDTGKSTVSPIADMKIGFVDAEGQGDKDVSYDANLICPILLASKCVIFNWKGDLQKDHILSTLGIMTRAARNVATDSMDGSASGGKPKKFGHLHIIFRDWQSVGSDEASTFNALFGIENTAEGSTRDQIRSDVMESFESIRVWLFDAPSELVSDLKKKLTFDKTSQAFRTQVRSLRAALSMQLREPTLFAGQPLLGKSYNVMINLIAESLNRGEVVLPSSAYLSMMRMEVDKIKADYENEMRSSIEKLLSDIDTASTSTLYPTENKAVKQLVDVFERVGIRFEGEIQQSIGSVSSALSSQILADYPQQIERINNILKDQFLIIFRHQFSKWLIAARKRAEAKLTSDFGHLSLRKDMPLDDYVLVTTLQGMLTTATEIIGGSIVYVNNEEVKDAEEILKRHFQQLADKFKTHNDTLKQNLRAAVVVHLNEVVAAMTKSVKESVVFLNKTERNGYSLEKLEQALNEKYFELRNKLVENCGKSRYTDEMKVEFKKVCGELREGMVEDYSQSKKSALNAALKVGQEKVLEAFNKVSKVKFDRNIHDEDWLTDEFNKCIAAVTKEVNDSVSGWLSTEGEDNELFASDLADALDGLAMNISENVLSVWLEIITKEDEAAATVEMESEPEVASRHYEEVEEDDDEDVYNKSGRVFQSKLGSNLSKQEQKERAKNWASDKLDIKPTKRGTSTATKQTKTSVPVKSVEQQRADAAAYAAKAFGESVLNNRSPVKSPKKPSVGVDEVSSRLNASEQTLKRKLPELFNDDSSNHKNIKSEISNHVSQNTNQNTSSSSSSSGGLFGNVKSWFGAPQESSPKKEVAPVASATTGANGKPLTAAQLAKAEMKRAEAERVANMVANKRAKK